MSRILALLDDRGRITTDPMEAKSARVVLDGGLEAVQPIDLREIAGRVTTLELSTRAYRTSAALMGYRARRPFCEESRARASGSGAKMVSAFAIFIKMLTRLPPFACASLRMIALKFLRSENVNRTYFGLRTMRTVKLAYPALSEPEQRMTP
jgi:hypothetical protein